MLIKLMQPDVRPEVNLIILIYSVILTPTKITILTLTKCAKCYKQSASPILTLNYSKKTVQKGARAKSIEKTL